MLMKKVIKFIWSQEATQILILTFNLKNNIEILNEDEDEEEEFPVQKRRMSQLNKGFPANDKRGKHTKNVFEFSCLTTENNSWVYVRFSIW